MSKFNPAKEKAAAFPWLEVLGVSRICTKAEAEEGYKKKAKIHHPNAGGNPLKWRELQEAYEQALKQLS